MEKILASIGNQKGRTSNRVIFILVGLSLLGFGAYAGVNQRNNALNTGQTATPQVSTAPLEESPKAESPHTLVYGFWAGDNSIIKAFNLETKASSVLASLPQNIKRISVKKPNELFFINGTNNFDHGKEIVKTTFGGKPEILVTADPGFGIDDYYLSPDGKYLTTWEVKLKPGERVLYGGNSRIYSISLSNPAVKNLLYDEVADKPVHYPRGITDAGTVLTDMFLPNSGPGWGYGMSSSDASGAVKDDIEGMTNGTYGRQPRISQDATMLSFSGYDGSKGSGTEQVDGIRKAVILPNTVEVIDTKSLQRRKLENVSNKFLYDDTRFDQDGKHLLVSQIGYVNKEYKPFVLVYDLEKNTAKTVPNSKDKRGFALLSDTQVFVSTPNVTGQTLGNLGETYQFLNSDFGIINPEDGKSVVLPISDSNMQFIGIFPNSELAIAFGGSGDEANRDALQLYSFTLKTSLLPDRINLQSTSRANVTNRRTNTLGLSTNHKLLAQVDKVAPIIPYGYTPAPGEVIPPNAVRPDGLPVFGNQTPINQQAPSGTTVSLAPSLVPSLSPSLGPSFAPSLAPTTVPLSPGLSLSPGVSAVPGEEDQEQELPGEIPDDIEGLLELLKQLLGILEEQSQN